MFPLDHIDTWVFDLDNTLYPPSCNLFAQIDARMTAFLSEFLQVDAEEARRLQKEYYHQYGTTLRGLMLRHGMAPREFLDFVHAIDHSAVPADPALCQALTALPGRRLIYTNGSVTHAERVITALGLGGQIDGIFDIEAAGYVPKPDPDSYRRMLARHGVDPGCAAMFEDLARNLEPAARLGMTTVWVTAQGGTAESFIHHVTADLAAWLAGVMAARRAY